jgi:cytochrome c biogenesis protein CcdA/glutaredoxin
MKTIKILFIILLLLTIFSSTLFAQEMKNEVNVYVFGTSICPYCANAKSYFENSTHDNLNVYYYELDKASDASKLFLELGKTFNVRTTSVPAIFISNKSWIGFGESTILEIEEIIEECTLTGCKDSIDYIYEPLKWQEYKTNEKYVTVLKETKIESFEKKKIFIHLFYTEECAPCKNTVFYFEQLKEDYPLINIQTHDISIQENKELFSSFKELYSLKVDVFPIAFIGETYITGENNIIKNLEKEIERCYSKETPCICPEDAILSKTNKVPTSKDYISGDDPKTISLFGKEINLESKSLVLNTVIIAFIDGINPCSLWVLLFLLSIVIYSGSRKKIFLVGFSFLLVTALVYGLFIMSVLNALIFFYSPIIKAVIVAIAIIFGLINIKDYFWYKKGISLTISDKYKPKLFEKIRNVMNPKNSILTILLGTIILAAGVAIVEIPCTAGLPLMWANIVAVSGISFTSYLLLLLLYILVYLSIEIAIFIFAIVTLKTTKFTEKHGKVLKLFSGLLIFGIGVIFLFFEKLLQSIFGMVVLLISAIVLTWLINMIYMYFKKEKKNV